MTNTLTNADLVVGMVVADSACSIFKVVDVREGQNVCLEPPWRGGRKRWSSWSAPCQYSLVSRAYTAA